MLSVLSPPYELAHLDGSAGPGEFAFMDVQNCNGETQHQPGTPATAKPKRDRIQQRHQAAALQRLAYDAAMAMKDACTSKETGALTMNPQIASAIHKLVGAWDTAADRLRVLRGRGLPASIKSKARPTRDSQPLEPL